MAEIIAGVDIPDSEMARRATTLVREAADDLRFHHSRRVFLWGSLKGRFRGLSADPELVYVGAMLHDLGLTPKYRTRNRFEVDGADLARDFLLDHGVSEADARKVWLSVALHTTPGSPGHLEPQVELVTLGVATDVLGLNLEQITDQQRAEVVAAHPRPGFKRGITRAFYEGMKDRPDTTFGTMNDDVLAAFEDDFERANFVKIIRDKAWPE